MTLTPLSAPAVRHPAAAWLLPGLAVAAAAAGLAGCAAPGAPRAQQPAAASAVGQDAAQGDPRRRARLRLELASAYFEQGQTEVALAELQQSLSHDPHQADAYNLRGLVYLRLQDPAESESSFRRALALDGGSGDVLHNYGYMLCQHGRHAEAQQRFDAALADPAYANRGKTWLVRGMCEARAGRPSQAEAAFRRVLELDPAHAMAAYQLAESLHRRGLDADARFYLRRLNNSDQGNAQSLWLGVKVERALGNRDTMLQLAEQLQRRYPDSRERVAYEGGRFEE